MIGNKLYKPIVILQLRKSRCTTFRLEVKFTLQVSCTFTIQTTETNKKDCLKMFLMYSR